MERKVAKRIAEIENEIERNEKKMSVILDAIDNYESETDEDGFDASEIEYLTKPYSDKIDELTKKLEGI